MSPRHPFASRSPVGFLPRRARARARGRGRGRTRDRVGAGAQAADYMLLADEDEDASEDISLTNGRADAAAASASASPRLVDRTERFRRRAAPRADLACESQVLRRTLSPARTHAVEGQGQEARPRNNAAKRAAKRTFGTRWSATAEKWRRNLRARVGSMIVSTAAAATAAWRKDSKASRASAGEEGSFARRQQKEKKKERTRSLGFDLVDGESFYSVSEDDVTPWRECWVDVDDDDDDDDGYDEEEQAWPVRRRALSKRTCIEEWEARIEELRAQRLHDEQYALSDAVARALQSALSEGRFDERQIDLRFEKCSNRLDDAHCMRKTSDLFREASALQREQDHREWMQMMEKQRTEPRRWSQFAFWR